MSGRTTEAIQLHGLGVSMIWFCCQENVVGAEIVKVLNRQSYSPQKFAGLGT